MEYTVEQLQWIDEEMAKIGINEYRFCTESNQYVCDKFGNIFSLYNRNQYGINFRVKKMLQHLNKSGYIYTRMMIEKKYKNILAHRVIAKAWLGIHEGLVVNHKNGIRVDNRLINLEFCTTRENNIHKSRLMKKRIKNENTVYYYLLHKIYGLTHTKINRIFFEDSRVIKTDIECAELVMSHFELTKEQIDRCINELFEMEEDKINKKLLKKYLESR